MIKLDESNMENELNENVITTEEDIVKRIKEIREQKENYNESIKIKQNKIAEHQCDITELTRLISELDRETAKLIADLQ